LKKQFRSDGTRFDATQGKCCCLYGNRRGVRCIIYFDSLNILTPWRQIIAIILLCCRTAEPLYIWYYYVRFISFWFQTLVMYLCLCAFVLYTLFYKDADSTLLTNGLWAAFFISAIVVIDYHWSTVVRFYAKHPSERTVKINWLQTDSEPDYAYQREGKELKKNGEDELPMHVFEQADQIILAVELQNDSFIDYKRNKLAESYLG